MIENLIIQPRLLPTSLEATLSKLQFINLQKVVILGSCYIDKFLLRRPYIYNLAHQMQERKKKQMLTLQSHVFTAEQYVHKVFTHDGITPMTLTMETPHNACVY